MEKSDRMGRKVGVVAAASQMACLTPAALGQRRLRGDDWEQARRKNNGCDWVPQSDAGRLLICVEDLNFDFWGGVCWVWHVCFKMRFVVVPVYEPDHVIWTLPCVEVSQLAQGYRVGLIAER